MCGEYSIKDNDDYEFKHRGHDYYGCENCTYKCICGDNVHKWNEYKHEDCNSVYCAMCEQDKDDVKYHQYLEGYFCEKCRNEM